MENVAFIGLGTMGIAMARNVNVIEGGYRVGGYDTNPQTAVDAPSMEFHEIKPG